MIASLNDASLLHNHDTVRIFNRAEAMRNHKGGASLHQRIHTALHKLLGPAVDRRSRLVKNQGRRIHNRSPRNREQLPLSLREICAVAAEHGLIAVRQAVDEAVRIRELCGFDALFIRRIQTPEADILHHRAGKEVGVLQYDAERSAEIRLFDF